MGGREGHPSPASAQPREHEDTTTMPHRTPTEGHALAFLTVDAAADTLGVSPKTVRRLIHRGELRARRLGRVYRIPAAELERVGRSPETIRGAVA